MTTPKLTPARLSLLRKCAAAGGYQRRGAVHKHAAELNEQSFTRGKEMTIVAAWLGEGFLLVGSDTQFGNSQTKVKTQGKKIHQIRTQSVVWGMAGNGDLYELIGQWMDAQFSSIALNAELSAPEVGDVIGDYLSQVNTRMIDRAARIRGGRRESGDAVSLMMAGVIHGQLTIYMIDTFGSVTTFPNRAHPGRRLCAIGSAEPILDAVHGTLQHYAEKPMTVEDAQLFFVRLLYTTVSIAEESVGFPIDVWVITPDGCRQMMPSEIERIQETLLEWKTRERQTMKSNV